MKTERDMHEHTPRMGDTHTCLRGRHTHTKRMTHRKERDVHKGI